MVETEAVEAAYCIVLGPLVSMVRALGGGGGGNMDPVWSRDTCGLLSGLGNGGASEASKVSRPEALPADGCETARLRGVTCWNGDNVASVKPGEGKGAWR